MADGAAAFEYQPKAKTLGPTIGDGQIEMRHLSPELFLEIQNLRMHKHSGVGSQRLRGFESIYKRTIREELLKDGAVIERVLKDGAVIERVIEDGAVTQAKAPTLLKGPASNYITAVGTALFENIANVTTADTTVTITGFTGNVKVFATPIDVSVANDEWMWWVDDKTTSNFKLYLRNTTGGAITVTFDLLVLGT